MEICSPWEVAKWRHSRKNSVITVLKQPDSTLTYDPQEMATTLSQRFFTPDSGIPISSFLDDPPPLPTCPWHPLTDEEIASCLKDTANTSAPGNSGIAWWMLKDAWPKVDKYLTWIFNGCLQHGTHPDLWKIAMVVVIPKPNRTDHFAAKNYRPISLLECISKLLEKAVSKHLMYAIDHHHLIPTTQFGMRAFSSTLDTGLALLHDAQTALCKGEKCTILLVDIKGFFDNVKWDWLHMVMENMGFPQELVSWMDSFLRGRKVHLAFNNFQLEEMDQPVGTPQGSPVSPILSSLYTAPLLSKVAQWTNSTLRMYVDDRVIFAHAQDWESVNMLLTARYRVCEEWFCRCNLSIELDKTELLYFRRPCAHKADDPPHQVLLPNLVECTYYAVQASAMVRYLGFFINYKLDWAPHVNVGCNWARTPLKALQVLGNSQHGLSTANWRLVFNAVCLPVLL